MNRLSGPVFEPSVSDLYQASKCSKCGMAKEGAHYNIFPIDISRGMEALRLMFPDGEANEMNFALFSTSGVHGSYATIEQIEASLVKYGPAPVFDEDTYPNDFSPNSLTIQIIQPRLCCLRYGDIQVGLSDILFLKKLRESSWKSVLSIGRPGQ